MIKALIFLTIFGVVIFLVLKTSKIDKKIIYTCLLIFSMSVIFLMTIFLKFTKEQSELNYNPPVFDGEKIIPGHFHEKN